MIKVIQNPSFQGYYEIYDDSSAVEEVQGRSKARRFALRLARKLKLSYFLFLGKIIDVD
jgi:hypothetical protein